MVLDKLLNLKCIEPEMFEHTLPESNVVISNLISRTDGNRKASLTVIKTNEHLLGLQMDIINNGNIITSNELKKGGLHLNLRGLGKLYINFIRRIKKFVTWQVTGSFHKAWCSDTEVNFRSYANLGYTEKSNKSAINQLNGINSEKVLKNNALNEIHKKNANRIIIAHLSINSIRSKSEMLKKVVGNKICILLISETKLDDRFPLNQFILEGSTPPYRVDRATHGGGLMLFVREDIPSKLLPNIDPSGNIENIFVEIKLK